MNEHRADTFLRLIRRAQRGRLKIYLGYAAGVGKTYQMLLEAHRLKADGIDVAIGYVESHGRADTQALIAGLELLPRRSVMYRGITIEEMDVDMILLRRPGVVLVDELAHTNVPGSKNNKRYQDVEELLEAGIHVISTLNVQHLESLYDTVERATSVKVRERIPDRIVAEADQIVNVDITTEDLRRRLKEGKVYTKERIETALENFFKPSNLEQLRELTLRELAAQIDSRQRDPQTQDVSSSPDQIMVCLSSRGPNSEALLRYGSRLAGRLNRNWYAVYVQTDQELPTVIDAATQRRLANTLALAHQLGAMVFTYKGNDVVKTILQFAHEYRVGHIILGSPGKRPSLWRRVRSEAGILERLVEEGKGITVVVLDTRTLPDEADAMAPAQSADKEMLYSEEQRAATIRDGVVLPETGIIIWDEPIEKTEAMQQLLRGCMLVDADRQGVWGVLMEREAQGGTFVGEDMAFPHARIAGLRHSIVALGIGRAGIADRLSGQDAHIMFLLLSPVESPGAHVQLLGTISRIARNKHWRDEVLTAKDRTDILRIINRRSGNTPATPPDTRRS